MQGEFQEQQPQSDLLNQLHSGINLITMMPPSKMKKNILGLINLAPQLEDNLYEKIELPMQINTSNSEQKFLQTELNRDGDSYRSPYTNKYIGQGGQQEDNEDSYYPSEKYRILEQNGNLLFNEYTKLYYGHEAVGSFYVLENESDAKKFTCGYYAKKEVNHEENGSTQSQESTFMGSWDSFHVIDITLLNDGTAEYSLQSTVMVEMNIEKATYGHMDLTGFLKDNKKVKKDLSQFKDEGEVLGNHIVTIGEMVEDLETQMRQRLEAIYISKTREVVFTMRFEETREAYANKYKLAQELKNVRLSKE